MASAPSSWKTLFKFLLEGCFQKATLQMSWCTPSLAKPQIYFSFSEFHLAEPTQSSEGCSLRAGTVFLWKGKLGSPGKRGARCSLATWAGVTQEILLGCPLHLPARGRRAGLVLLSAFLGRWLERDLGGRLLFPIQVEGAGQQ